MTFSVDQGLEKRPPEKLIGLKGMLARNNAGEGCARGHLNLACHRSLSRAPLKKRTQQIFAKDNLPETPLRGRKELGLCVCQSLCLPPPLLTPLGTVESTCRSCLFFFPSLPCSVDVGVQFRIVVGMESASSDMSA